MGERGPKPESSNLINLLPTNEKRRPKPFHGMNQASKRIWYRIVNDLPVDFYKQHELDLLREYCETAARLIKAKSEMERTGGAVVEKPIIIGGEVVGTRLVENPWVGVISKSNGALCTLATKLRLAKNAKVSHQDAALPMKGKVQSSSRSELLFGGREF